MSLNLEKITADKMSLNLGKKITTDKISLNLGKKLD